MSSSKEQKPTTSTAHNDEDELCELSPIDRRLKEGRSYNDGNWDSVELKKLYDALAKYGTKPSSLNYIASSILTTRSLEEITTKLFEIREMISEHREDIVEYHKADWIEKGHRNIKPVPAYVSYDNMNWSKAVDAVDSMHEKRTFSKFVNPIRETIAKILEKQPAKNAVYKDAKVTDIKTSRLGDTARQEVSWPRIYDFMATATRLGFPLPVINELEAAIILNVLGKIEDEASEMSDSDKAVSCGMFSDIEMGDSRMFEPDFPCKLQSAVQILVDPLRTRMFGIPEVGAEPNFDVEEVERVAEKR